MSQYTKLTRETIAHYCETNNEQRNQQKLN
jgi:hypothetical protein